MNRTSLSTLLVLLLCPLAVAVGDVKVTREKDLATITWVESLADPAAKAGEVPFSILSGPYLGWLDEQSATIGWEVIAQRRLTTKPYASLPGNYDLKKIAFRSAALKGLEPNTVYRYRLTSSGKGFRYMSRVHAFRTFPPRGAKKLRFAVIGDTQRFGRQPWTDINRRLYADIEKWNSPLVLHLGDLVYDSWGPGINGRKGWYRLMHLCRDLRAERLLAPCMGNHDVKPGVKIWGPDYFRDIPASGSNQAGRAQPPFYYSFDVAGVHFVALCTELRRDGPRGEDLSQKKVYGRFSYRDQLAWLEQDLRAARATWTIVFFHQPLHTVGGYPARAEFRKDFGRLFDKYRVPLVLSGHDHSYQRTRRITNATRVLSDTGTVQVISGGASNLFDGGKAPWNVMHKKINHYLRVEVHDDRIRFDAVRDNGSTFDSWTLPKTGQPTRPTN